MTKKNLAPVIRSIDEILSEIVWCEKGEYVSLAQKLSTSSKKHSNYNLADLTIAALRGAFINLQIRYELFDEKVEDFSKKDLVTRIKNLIFAQVKYNLARIKKAA